MKNHKHHQWKNKLLGSIFMIWIFFWWWSFAEVINTQTLINGLDQISEKSLDSEKFTTMVEYFCDAVDNGKTEWYDSSQSLFVYYVCKSAKKTSFFKDNGFIGDAKTSYTKFSTNDDGKSKVRNTLIHIAISFSKRYFFSEQAICSNTG